MFDETKSQISVSAIHANSISQRGANSVSPQGQGDQPRFTAFDESGAAAADLTSKTAGNAAAAHLLPFAKTQPFGGDF